MIETDSLYVILEISSVLFNLLFIFLLIQERKSCWIFGIIGSVLGAILFYYQQYFSESILYVFYAVMGVYGYVIWNRPKLDLKIHRIRLYWHGIVLFFGAILTFALGKYMSRFDADRTYYDAFSTVFGVVATFLEMYKVLSAWIYWIILNLFSIWLYAVKGWWIYAALMVIYAVLSVHGLYIWTKRDRAQKRKDLVAN